MLTASAATTGRPFGACCLSSGCTMRKRTPSRPTTFSVATTVPITLPSCTSSPLAGPGLDPGEEPEVPGEVLGHRLVELRDHTLSHEVAGGALDGGFHRSLDLGHDTKEEHVALAAETVGEPRTVPTST